MTRLLLLLFAVPLIFLSSCREFTKLLKSQDLDRKYTEALKYYEKGKCMEALQLFEELLTVYKGTPKAESIYYYYAYSNYCVGDYLLAAYHFKTFVRNYPASKHAEECAFMAAVCYYHESPRYSLDQTDTKNAIRELQNYINRYPEGSRLDSCNRLIDKLRGKLEKKDFEIAMQYYHMEDYKAAITALNNVLREFPDTKYREEVNYFILRATYDQALRSVDEKKLERLDQTIELHQKFSNAFSDTGRYGQQAYYIGKSASIQRERSAWEIPVIWFENRKYAKSIEGFKEYLTRYPSGPYRQKAEKYISDAYFLLVQFSYQNIEKQYSVPNVLSAAREFSKNYGKYKPLIDAGYEKQLLTFVTQAPYISLDRGMDQLKESFRLEDVNALIHYKSLSDYYAQNIDQVNVPEKRTELEKKWKQIQAKKEEVDRQIGIWFFEKTDYEKSREILKKYFPVREGDELQSKSFYYYVLSLWETAKTISVLRPDFRTVYFDSLKKLRQYYEPLLTSGYKRKIRSLYWDINESWDHMYSDQVEALYKSGQYDSIVSKSTALLLKELNADVKSSIAYYRVRTFYERASYGSYSADMQGRVLAARGECSVALTVVKGKDRRKVKKMSRKLRKREKKISRYLAERKAG